MIKKHRNYSSWRQFLSSLVFLVIFHAMYLTVIHTYCDNHHQLYFETFSIPDFIVIDYFVIIFHVKYLIIIDIPYDNHHQIKCNLRNALSRIIWTDHFIIIFPLKYLIIIDIPHDNHH